MSIDADTGRIDWIPAVSQQNAAHPVTVKVFDRRGGADTTSFTIDVEPAAVFFNSRPTITSVAPESAVTFGAFHYPATAQDDDGDALTWRLLFGPDGAGIDPQSGDLVWTPRGDQVGLHPFAVRVSDPHGAFDYQNFTVHVTAQNMPPTITSTPTGPISVAEPWSYQVVASDPNGDPLRYTLDPASVVGNMQLDPQTGLLTWTPASVGHYRIELAVDDGRGGYDVQGFSLQVASNSAPQITSQPSVPAIVGQAYSYTIIVDEPDGDAYTIALDDDSLARGIDLTGNALNWTPTSTGDVAIQITVVDGHGAWTRQSFTLPVRPPVVESAPPEITSNPTGPAYVGTPWTYTVTATDPDDTTETLVFSLQAPVGDPQVAWNASTRLLSWTPASGDVPDGKSFTIRVSDPAGSWTEQSFTVPAQTAPAAGQPPEITSIPTGPAIVHQPYVYQVVAHDPNGDPLQYSLVSPPSGMTIDSVTGKLTFTPGAIGNYAVEVRVDDNQDGHTSQTFILAVVNPPVPDSNLPPRITSKPSGPAHVNTPWTYALSATDPDGDDAQIVYSLVAPSAPGVSFDPPTGLLTWVPTGSGTLSFVLRATDPDGAFDEQTFTIPAITAAPPANQPPNIRSIPPNPVRLNDLYRYQVDAFDPNGDALTYWLVSAPVGMAIDAHSGLLVWNPSAIGSYAIEIAVSDGIAAPTTQSYTLAVVAPVKLNDPPEITSNPTGPAVRDRLYRYQATATDPDGDAITWSLDAASTARGITVGAATGLLAWTPTTAGAFPISLTAADGAGGQQTQTFTLTVLHNAPPVITSAPVTAVALNQS